MYPRQSTILLPWPDKASETCLREGLRAERRIPSNSDPSLLAAVASGDSDSEKGGSARILAVNLGEGYPAPDCQTTSYIHISPLLLRVMSPQLETIWTRVQSLSQLGDNLWSREYSDLGLLMARLQLVGEV